VPVRLKGIRIERPRQFGDVYLTLAMWRGTGLEALCERLLPIGKERIAWSKMTAVLVAARFCEPSSELHIAGDWYRRTALSDLLQLGDEEVNKDRLYRGLDHLLAYTYTRKTSASASALIINEQEAAVIRSMFEMYGSGNYGLSAISRTLEERGIGVGSRACDGRDHRFVQSPSAEQFPGKLDFHNAPFLESKSRTWEFFTDD